MCVDYIVLQMNVVDIVELDSNIHLNKNWSLSRDWVILPNVSLSAGVSQQTQMGKLETWPLQPDWREL